MMKILYIALSCRPDKGSESRIGWNIPLESSKTNQVFVITNADNRQVIEEYTEANPLPNVEFHYVGVSDFKKKIYRGMIWGFRLKEMHRNALPLAERICKENDVKIIHQITPIEIRSIGDYGKIPGVKFVCGPLGGGEYIPKGLRRYAKNHLISEISRKLANEFSMISLKRRKTASYCDAVLYANEETKTTLKKGGFSQHNRTCVTELGARNEELTDVDKPHVQTEECTFLVAGRLNYRKGHKFLFDVLKDLPRDRKWKCVVAGNGPEEMKVKKYCEKSGLSDRVEFVGRVSYEEMADLYRNASALILPSLRDTSGAVMIEAVTKGVPVITVKRFGGALLLDEASAWFYDGNTNSEFIDSLRAALLDCMDNLPERILKSQAAAKVALEHTYEGTISMYKKIYDEITI